MFTAEELDAIIKAYDIRGLVDGQVTEDFAFALGCAYAKFLEEEREPSTVVVGEDMRQVHHCLQKPSLMALPHRALMSSVLA
jgi:phosphomannomutase